MIPTFNPRGDVALLEHVSVWTNSIRVGGCSCRAGGRERCVRDTCPSTGNSTAGFSLHRCCQASRRTFWPQSPSHTVPGWLLRALRAAGDVVIARSVQNPRHVVCKRVLGLEGDTVTIPSSTRWGLGRTVKVGPRAGAGELGQGGWRINRVAINRGRHQQRAPSAAAAGCATDMCIEPFTSSLGGITQAWWLADAAAA